MKPRSFAALLVAGGLSIVWSVTSSAAPAPVVAGPTPGVACAKGALPESMQGRVAAAEVTSGRAAKGYRCNALQVSHDGESGGYHVFRYRDAGGHVCAYYDTTVLVGRDLQSAVYRKGPGVVVLDMSDPRRPVQTDLLATAAMVTPHESLRLNERRGLLVAVAGLPVALPGQMDVYDVRQDCRHPVLQSTTPTGLLGHESGFTPDGLTYWTTSWLGSLGTLAATDLSDPKNPQLLTVSTGYVLHGLSFSADGRTLYGTDQNSASSGANKGLRILDVTDVQARRANPQIRQVSYLRWPDISTPQITEPITVKGRPYLLEADEFDQDGRVGAARIIDIADVRHPRVVSSLRLAVNDTTTWPQLQDDPGYSGGLQTYTGHYCSVPRRTDPHIVACSFILSGLRVFDIRDPKRPREVAYFNPPGHQGSDQANPVTRVGSFAMSGPTFDLARGQVWYSDANTGFYAVQLVGAARAAMDGRRS